MGLIRNLLAVVGLVALIVGALAYGRLQPVIPHLDKMMPLMGKMDQLAPMIENFDRYKPLLDGFDRYQAAVKDFDPKAEQVYLETMNALLASKNAAEATVWKVKVKEGLTPEDVEQAMKMVANEHNMSAVGELPLYKDVEAKAGQPYRFVKIFLFCNSLIAKTMLDYSDAYSAYLPCRVTLIDDGKGQLWLYTLNMDMMIHGGAELPPDLKAAAIKVKETILDIMHRGAEGDF